jgi:NADH dehydrogenase (ubiquinone) 1 alpha/beta subcomplex 1, acyl-carrier protein
MSLFRLAARSAPATRQALATQLRMPRALPFRAGYAATAGLSKDDIQTRIFGVLKGFEKVDPQKVRVFESSYDTLY